MSGTFPKISFSSSAHISTDVIFISLESYESKAFAILVVPWELRTKLVFSVEGNVSKSASNPQQSSCLLQLLLLQAYSWENFEFELPVRGQEHVDIGGADPRSIVAQMFATEAHLLVSASCLAHTNSWGLF